MNSYSYCSFVSKLELRPERTALFTHQVDVVGTGLNLDLVSFITSFSLLKSKLSNPQYSRRPKLCMNSAARDVSLC